MTGRGARSALLPFALLWLAAHAVLLAVFLGLKFLTAKAAALLLAAGVLWLLVERAWRIFLPPPSGVV